MYKLLGNLLKVIAGELNLYLRRARVGLAPIRNADFCKRF